MCMSLESLIGQRFGRLIVIERGKKPEDAARPARYWYCRCDCGKTTNTNTHLLLNGEVRSCGCLHRDVSRVLGQRLGTNNRTHGESGGRKKKESPEYKSWHSMWQRCLNPKSKSYQWYGKRGITVCAKWRTFSRFLADMGRRPTLKHSLDRVDPNGNYTPENCRWATPTEQQRNHRDRRLIKYKGEALPLWRWIEVTGLPRSTLSCRLHRGWAPKEALTEPKRRRQST